MDRWIRLLRASSAACLLALAGCPSLAAAAAETDEPLAVLQAAYARAVTAGEQADFHRELFATVLARVQRSYATEVDLPAFAGVALKTLEPLPPGAGEPAAVFRRAINTALRTLDPYSRYIDPAAYGAERDSLGGSFGGVGLEIESAQGVLRVIAPIPGSPAARAGLQRGDLILRIDEHPLAGLPLADAIARMRGAPGTGVSLTVQRAGSDEFTVALTRETIRRQVLRWTMEGEVLVLRLGVFSGNAAVALKQAADEATARHAPRGVVLDLRGNPGGLVREAVQTADAFLARGEIVSLQGRPPASRRSWQADEAQVLAGIPLVVLLDARSASASELVADALQANGRATVMGQRSFGKGSVQTTYPLGDGKGALKLTTSTYHGPGGTSVQKTGVAPDIELLASSAPGEAPRDGRARVEEARCAALYKAADAALSCAIAYLRAGDLDAFLAGTAQHEP